MCPHCFAKSGTAICMFLYTNNHFDMSSIFHAKKCNECSCTCVSTTTVQLIIYFTILREGEEEEEEEGERERKRERERERFYNCSSIDQHLVYPQETWEQSCPNTSQANRKTLSI